ncbi:MAG TPA: hypothetical protein VM187_05550, partial [Niastella sp.]|nr:hypothetical protein [Niastella sp.]
MATKQHIAELIIKYRKNLLSAYEKEELEAWRDHSKENQLHFERLSGPGYDNMVELYNSLSTTENNSRGWQLPAQQRKRMVVTLVYASIIICLLFAGMAVYSVVSK